MRLPANVFIAFLLLLGFGCTSSHVSEERVMLLESAIRTWKDTLVIPVSINGGITGSITGVLFIPREGKGKYPAVIALHGYTDNKEAWLDPDGFSKGGKFTRILLDKGFTVLAIDLPHHGARLPYGKLLDQKRLVLDNWQIFYADALSDVRHAIDFLCSCSRIDSSRIGLVGYSLGGMLAYSVANTDKRIRVLATCVAPPDRGEIYPGAPHRNIDRLSDIPVLVIAATHDHNYPVEDAEWFFDQLPSRIKEYEEYDSSHSLPGEYATRAARWFVRFLGK